MSLRNKKVLDPSFKKSVSKALDELKSALYELHDAAVRDEKTGTYNHRFFTNMFNVEFEKAKRKKQKLSLITIDIDFFKKVNDTYGHLTGDKILIELAKKLENGLRKYDILSRFGGEEFFILLPTTPLPLAKKVAERLRKSLPSNQTLKKYKITISIGVTEYKEKDTILKMSKRADKALYQSKKNGRNCVSSL